MSRELADAGVATWVVDIRRGTISYCDLTDTVMIEEAYSGDDRLTIGGLVT